MMSRPAYVVGELFAFPLADERWGGLQISYIDDIGGPEVVALDLVSDHQPTRAELAEAKPLWLSHHAHSGVFCRARVGQLSHPWDFVALGTAPLVTSFEDRSSAWSHWSYARYQVLAQWRWDHETDPAAREAFKNIDAGDQVVEVSTGGERRRVDRATRQLALLPQMTNAAATWQLPAPAGAPVAWDELAALQSVNELTYAGRDDGVLALAERLPLLDRLVWRDHRRRDIDLSPLRVREVVVDAGATLTIKLPSGVDTLTVNTQPDTEWVAIDDPFDGRRLELVLGEPLPPVIAGPSALRRMRVSSLQYAPCPRFARCRQLHELELSGAPGKLVSPAALSELPDLRQLSLLDFYAIDGEIPPRAAWPALDTLSFDGLSPADAETLRQRMHGLRRLEISTTREPSATPTS